MDEKPRTFSKAIEDLEKLTNGAAQELPKRLQEELAKVEETLKNLKPQLEEIKTKVGDELKEGKSKAEAQIQQNPWAAMGVVALVFFILGLLFSPRGRRDD
ncbi:MAG: YqjD family protein [Bdellovibrionales bacterium]